MALYRLRVDLFGDGAATRRGLGQAPADAAMQLASVTPDNPTNRGIVTEMAAALAEELRANNPAVRYAEGRVLVPERLASGSATIHGTGGVVPRGTRLQNERGFMYVTTEDAMLTEGVAVLQLQAERSRIGGFGLGLSRTFMNRPEGAVLTVVDPPAGIASTATVLAGGLVGADELLVCEFVLSAGVGQGVQAGGLGFAFSAA